MRVISNRSTGELGQKLALAFAAKGAVVTLLEGPVQTPLVTKKIKIVKFQLFAEFSSLFKKFLKQNFDLVVHAAAVSDYQIARPATGKLASGLSSLNLNLVPTPKLINQIKTLAPKSLLVGFKLESTTNKRALIDKANTLFTRAKCDLVVANSTKNGYRAYILDNNQQILATATSRSAIVAAIVKTVSEKI